MKLSIVSPAKSLSKAYLRQSVKREQIEQFKKNLVTLFDRIREEEHEEHLKNIVADFLKDTWYKPAFEINTSKRADLVIHTGKSSDNPVGVIIETKKPSNKSEMITPERPNTKALHELLHYYMQERYVRGNQEIKRLIVSNIYEWYIFDAVDFERFFFGNQKLIKSYKDWNEGLLVGTNTDWFYQEIARPFIEKELAELPCTCFDLRDFEKIARTPDKTDDRKLINLYKLLSPAHLLKQPFANDSNSLNREFYNELLHIIGLEEIKEKGKKLIRRKSAGARLDGSLLENTINILNTRSRLSALPNPAQYGTNEDDQLFSVALELCITWLNRLLFLKLLEGQLIAYRRGNRDYAFLNCSRMADFDELNELFFEVLAVRAEERSPSVQSKFGNIPYLNSSLFEETDLERATLRINELKNRLDLPLYSATVLKDTSGKRLTGGKNTLAYLFNFLDAYDFGAEGGAEIQEQNKSIINASVLGLIFEKINGYRDGSFFTPGFITMYICRETIRRSVAQKFNEKYGWNCADITDVHNELIRQRIPLHQANEVVNSLTICDPAVGSGHFLVSALNEIISVKSELKILADRDGKLIRCDVSVENDELIVTVDEAIFAYNRKDGESQRVQETLFHEKATIIENCLFGVDINPKSVAICRLRLWIELLKNAYYRRGTEDLETLPNIDINIKCGNSLVSRFALAGTDNLPATSRNKLRELTEKYRRHVFEYKLSPSNKSQLRKVIDNLKHDLENFGLPNDKDMIALRKKENEVAQLGFAFDKQGAETRQKLMEEAEKLRERFAEKERLVYANAFEWRFEFPEVLDENGEFVGFDAIIGNPPYIRIQDLKTGSPIELATYKQNFGAAAKGNYDIYVLFIENSLSLLSPNGKLCFILPHKFFNSEYGEGIRRIISDGRNLDRIIHFREHQVFDEATTYCCLLFLQKPGKPTFEFTAVNNLAAWRTGIDGASVSRVLGCENATHAEWNFSAGYGSAIIDKLHGYPVRLGDVADVFVGLQTSADSVFIMDYVGENAEGLCLNSKQFGIEWTFERDLLHPLISGTDVKRYQGLPNRQFILFPYRIYDGKAELIPFTEITKRWPLTADYLFRNREKLEGREGGKLVGKDWHGYIYLKNMAKQSLPKICIPRLVDRLYAGYDASGEHFLDNVDVGGITPKAGSGLDILLLLGLLNSTLLRWYFPHVSAPFRGGWLSANRQFLSQLAMPSDITTQEENTTAYARIAELAHEIYQHDGNYSEAEAEIDRLVYDLYGLTEEEIAIVEGKSNEISNNAKLCLH